MAQYLLPCTCGANIPISRTQAGMSLPCPQCGQSVDVPTIRQIEALQSAEAAPIPTRKKQSTLLKIFSALSLLVGLICLFNGGWMYAERFQLMSKVHANGMDLTKTEADYLADMKQSTSSLTPADTWDYWNEVTERGLVQSEPPDFFRIKRHLESNVPWIQGWFAAAAASLSIFAITAWNSRKT